MHNWPDGPKPSQGNGEDKVPRGEILQGCRQGENLTRLATRWTGEHRNLTRLDRHDSESEVTDHHQALLKFQTFDFSNSSLVVNILNTYSYERRGVLGWISKSFLEGWGKLRGCQGCTSRYIPTKGSALKYMAIHSSLVHPGGWSGNTSLYGNYHWQC